MLASVRQEKLVEIVNKKKSISAKELMHELQVSEVTIRRDITQLAKLGLITKVHGGAMSKQGIQEIDSDVSIRETMYKKEKELIAKYAASTIKDFDVIYLDAGSSIAAMIPYINASDIVVVTNSIEHAKRLTKRKITCYLLGGSIKLSTDAMVGADALRMIDNYNFSKGFFGTNGVSLNNGCTTPDRNEAEVKHRAMTKCNEAFVLFDDTKYETVSAVRFAEIDEVTLLSNHNHPDYKHLTNYKVVKS